MKPAHLGRGEGNLFLFLAQVPCSLVWYLWELECESFGGVGIDACTALTYAGLLSDPCIILLCAALLHYIRSLENP